MNSPNPRAACCLLILFSLTLFASCTSKKTSLPQASVEERAELAQLMAILEEKRSEDTKDTEKIFILWEKIISIYLNNDQPQELLTLLGKYVQENPEDPFNGYYLYTMAQEYRSKEQNGPAAQYLTLLLNNHSDLRINDESLHFLALKDLIQITDDPYERLHYYQEINERYPRKLDPGSYHYYLARTYEDIGEWDKAIGEYRQFLSYPETVIQGNPGVYKQIRNKVAFYDSNKSWAREDLNTLIASIKYATRTLNLRALQSYQSRVDFFLLSWDHADDSDYTFNRSTFNIKAFLRTNIHYAPELDTDSNEKEAFLRSTGWSYIGPWYFYFRKVDFPADPEINGRWEWAGIYFGEKL